jgi:RNA polymerase sigma factor (sigma-70 family)
LPTPDKLSRFEEAILPHLDAAYNLARWLMRNDADADDAVQDAYLRALRFFGGFRGGDGRAWLLAIVRNTCYSKLKRNRVQEVQTAFDEEIHGQNPDAPGPETVLLESLDAAALQRAVEALPEEFREVVVMRELQGLSYKEIASVTEVPIGTVMSRLARARGRLQRTLKLESPEKTLT